MEFLSFLFNSHDGWSFCEITGKAECIFLPVAKLKWSPEGFEVHPKSRTKNFWSAHHFSPWDSTDFHSDTIDSRIMRLVSRLYSKRSYSIPRYWPRFKSYQSVLQWVIPFLRQWQRWASLSPLQSYPSVKDRQGWCGASRALAEIIGYSAAFWTVAFMNAIGVALYFLLTKKTSSWQEELKKFSLRVSRWHTKWPACERSHRPSSYYALS